MTHYLMKVLGTGTTLHPHVAWLEAYDVDAFGGRGFTRLTVDRARALKFPSFEALMAAWKQQSRVQPLRPDGRPNRPVSAYTIEVERIDE